MAQRAAIEPLEPRVLLSGDGWISHSEFAEGVISLTSQQKTLILDGMTALEGKAGLLNTSGALGDAVSLLGQGLGAAFDVEGLFDTDVIGLSRNYFNGRADWTLEGWAEYLQDNSALSTLGGLSYDSSVPNILSFTCDISGQVSLLNWQYDLNSAFEDWDFDTLGFSTAGNLSISVSATFSGSLTLGVDLNLDDGSPLGFFVSGAGLSLDMSFSGSTPLSIDLGMFSLQTGTIAGTGVQVDVSLVDPDSSGKIYTGELTAGGAELVSASFDSSAATVEVPLEFAATPGATVDALTVTPVLAMTSDDFVTASDLVVGASNLGSLIRATALSPQAMASGFLQLAQYIGGVQSIEMMRQELPLVAGVTVGDILDIPLAVSDGINSLVVSVDGGTGQTTPLFADFGDLSTLLTSISDLIHVDPNTRELTIDFDYQYDFTAFDEEITFSAGVADLTLSTSSNLSLDGSVQLTFSLGVQIAPDQVLDILPAGQDAPTEDPLAAINNGQLGSDAHFTIYLDGWDDYEVTVTSGSTSTNSNLLDLVVDVNSALASAGLGGEVEAYLMDFNVLGREVTADDFSNPEYEGTGIIGFRTVTAGEYWALRVHVEAGDVAQTQLGYPEDLSAKPGLLEFFIDDTGIAGTVTLTAADVAATGSFNIVEITLGGSASITGSASGNLINPDTLAGRIDFSDFQQFAADKRWGEMLDMSLTGSGAVTFDDVQVAGLGGLSLGASPQISVLIEDINDPTTLTPQFDDLGNLMNLQNLSIAETLALLSQGTEFLSTVDGLEFLQYRLPIINLSAVDLLDVASDWASAVEQATAGGEDSGSLQLLDGNLDSFFGGMGSSSYSLALDGTDLKFTLDYSLTASESFPFQLDLSSLLSLAAGDTSAFDALSYLIDVSGSSNIEVGAQAAVSLALGLDLSDPGNPQAFIYDESNLSMGVRAEASELDFNFSFGSLNLFVKDGWAVLDGDGDAGTVDYAAYTITLTNGDGDGKHYIGDAGEPLLDDLTQDIVAAAGMALPVYFPSDSIPLGGAGNNEILLTIADLADVMTATPGSVSITAPDLNDIFSGVNIIQVLSDPGAVLDGLQSQFNLVTSSLESIISYASLPLVGDQLIDAVGFVQDLGNDLLSQVRTTLNRALDGQSPTDLLRSALFSAFGSILTDQNGDEVIDVNDVIMDIDEADYQYIEYRLEMGDTLLDYTIDFGGIDIIPLDLDGQLNVSISWSWNFGFGLDVTDGFYVVSSWEPELSLNVDVTMPEDLHGELFFLDADVTSMNDAGTAVDRNRSMVYGAFEVDLVDPSGDGRLTLAEIRGNSVGDLITAGFVGGLSADLRLTLSIGGSDVFPQFRTVASFDWLYDKTFGEPVVTVPLTVEFTSVELNLGSLINGFLRPIFEQVDEIVDPIRPVLDFLQQELPVINATVLDVAAAFGYGNYVDFINAVSWVADMAAAVASAPTGEFWLDMGSFSVAGDSGTSAGGAITPTSTPDFQTNLTGSGADADTKNFLTQANTGNGFFTLNLLQPSTIFNLIMGNDATLMTFSIPNLVIAANYSQYFPVYGPLGMRISGSASATLHLGFGYDTYGLRRARETGNWSYLLDGFYISDRANADGTGADTPEVVFGLSFTAAAELNLGIASGGVSGGLYGNMDLDLADPDNDGKLRMTELWINLQDPRKLFDISILVTAEVRWYLKVGIGALSKTWSGTIASVTIYEDTFTAPRDEVLVKEATDGQIVLNVGPYAADRLYDDTSDGAETVSVSASGSDLTVVINGVSQTITYQAGDVLTIEAGNGDDVITIDASVQADVVINGGAGNDTIRYNGSGSATIDGGEGNDNIYGGGQADVLSGGTGNDHIEGGAGNDTLDGGEGNDTLDGGGGDDTYNFIGDFGDDTLLDSGGSDTADFSATAAPLTFDITVQRLDNTKNESATMNFIPELVVGSSGSDTLYARDEANLWTISGANAGNYNTLFDWQSFEQLVGRTEADHFLFEEDAYVSGRIDGGAGAENEGDADYATQIAGDLIDLAAYTTSNRWQISEVDGGRLYLAGASPTFTSVENHTGGSDRDYLVFSNDQYVVGIFDGNGGEDRIDLSDYQLVDVYKRNIWDFTGVNQGGINERTAFTEVENQTGGQIEDIFYIYPAGTYAAGFLHAPASATGGGIDGEIDSEDRNDTISGSPVVRVSQGLEVEQSLSVSQGLAPGADSRLDESAYDVIWEITGNNSGTRTDINGTVTFENLQNIEGSPDDELFVIYVGGSMDGFIDGKGGSDALIYGWGGDAYADAVTIDFQNASEASATGAGGGILNMELIIAGTNANDTFIGPNLACDWQFTGVNAGTMNTGTAVQFEDFDNVTGGTGIDEFAFTADGDLTGALAGGGGTDVIDLSALAVTVAAQISGANQGQVAFNGHTVSFSQIESLLTGTLADTITFQGNTAELTGLIDAGTGNDSIVYSGVTTARTINVDYADGGRLSRTAGTTPFDGVENITTGAGDDRVVFANGGSLTGAVDTGTGTDVFDYSLWDAISPVSVNLQTSTASGTGSFANTEQFLGGQSLQNQLTARNVDNTWAIDGIDDGTVDDGSTTVRFYNFQRLTGGTGADEFAFDDLTYVHGPIDGAGGTDTLDFSGYSLQQTWSVTAANAGTLRMTETLDPLLLSFSGIENITAGDATNTFTFSDGATLEILQGGSGADALSLAAYTTSIEIDLQAMSMTPIGLFGGLEQITASSAEDTLIGQNALRNWYIYDTNALYYNATVTIGSQVAVTGYDIDFRSVENLTGGTTVDTFYFADGAGIDGALNAVGASNAASWRNYTTEVGVNLEDQTATGVGGTWSNLTSFTGGSAVDTLTAWDGQANTWAIQSTDAGQINAGTATFQRFGNLAGGSGDDEFVFSDAAAVTGQISGAGGTNTLNYAAYTTPVAIDLATTSGTGLDGFADIDAFIGGAGSDTLAGPNAEATWTVSGANAGTLAAGGETFTFADIESLAGGTDDDTFVLPTGGSLGGTIDGGDGWDDVDYSSRAASVAVDRQAGTASSTGGFADVEEFTASAAGADQLTGLDAAATWNLTENFGGNINGAGVFRFHGFEQLTGGSNADEFILSAGTDSVGTLDGGAGDDSLSLAAHATGRDIDLTGANAGTVNGVGDFTGIENLTATQGDDAIVFADGASLSGLADGQDGDDTLDYSAYQTAVTVDMEAGTATGLGEFADFENFIAGQATGNEVTGPAAGGQWRLTGENAFTLNDTYDFTDFDNLQAGDGDDVFVFEAGGQLTGTLDGGAGDNTADFSNFGADLTVNLADGEVAGFTGTLNGMTELIGDPTRSNTLLGTNADTLWQITDDDAGLVNGMPFAGFGTLVGGSGVDQFVFADGKVVSGSLDGGNGLDSINLDAYTTINTWTSLGGGSIEVETNFGTFTYESIENFSGNMSVFLFAHSDLLAQWLTIDLPPVIVPGESVQVTVRVTNLSNVQFRDTVDVTVYASTDTVLDAGTDVVLGTVAARLNLRQDEHSAVAVTLNLPVDMDFGDYYLIAKVDALEAFEEMDETNNTAVSLGTQTVSPYFGELAGRRGVVLELPQNDGVLEFRMSGPGWGMVGDGGIIELFDTTEQTRVQIVKVGGELPGELPGLVAVGSVGQILADGIVLTGDIDITGGLGRLVLGDLDADVQNLIRIGESTLAGQILLGTVTNADIETASPIAQLQTGAWLDTDAEADDLTLTEARTVLIGGQMDAAVAGEAIGTYDVRGDLNGDVLLTGDLQQLKVLQDVESAVVAGGMMRSAQLGGGLNGSLEVDGDLQTFSCATLAGRLETMGQMRSLSVNGDLSGEAFIFRSANRIQVSGGDVSGSIGTNEQIGSLTIRQVGGVGGALTGSVEAGDGIRTLRTSAASSGVIDSPGIGSLTLPGGFNGTIRAVAAGGEPRPRGGYSLGTVRVTGGDLLGTVTADSIRTLSVRDGDVGADIVVAGTFNALDVGGRGGGNMLVGSSLTVGGDMNTARIAGVLTGVWDIGGDVRTIRHGGVVDDWTLQTPVAQRVSVRSLQLADVQQMTMTGMADVRMLRAGSFAAGTLEANCIGNFVCQGNMLADMALQGVDLTGRVLNLARVAGNVTDATWNLNGAVGNIRIGGDQTGFNLITA